MSECLECLAVVEKLHDDPRTPPLEIVPCLCASCARASLDDMIEDLTQQREALGDD